MLRGQVWFWFLDRVLPLSFVQSDWGFPLVWFVKRYLGSSSALSKFDSPDTDVARLDFNSKCPLGSLVCLSYGDESGLGAEKPKHLPLNIVGSVRVIDCLKADQRRVARTFVMTSNNYQTAACTRVQYWASCQLSTVVYLVLGSI